jgi:hypothetical protein
MPSMRLSTITAMFCFNPQCSASPKRDINAKSAVHVPITGIVFTHFFWKRRWCLDLCMAVLRLPRSVQGTCVIAARRYYFRNYALGAKIHDWIVIPPVSGRLGGSCARGRKSCGFASGGMRSNHGAGPPHGAMRRGRSA